MTGLFTATHIVIINFRKIVMNQGISMHQLQCSSYLNNSLTIVSEEIIGSNHQIRTDSFATGKKGMSHSFMNLFRILILSRQEPVQGYVYQFILFLQVLLKYHSLFHFYSCLSLNCVR